MEQLFWGRNLFSLCSQIQCRQIQVKVPNIVLLDQFQRRIQGAPRRPPPRPTAPNFLNFMQFFGKFGKIICWPFPLEGWRPPSPTGNPVSASKFA